MRNADRFNRNSLPMTIIRHLEQTGLGRGHDLYPNSFWIKSDKKRKR